MQSLGHDIEILNMTQGKKKSSKTLAESIGMHLSYLGD